MGGGGKAESTPWRGPAGAQRPPHGAAILLWEREGKALGVPAKQERSRQAPSAASRHQHRHPCTARSQPDGVRAQLCVSAHPAMREARVPAGQDRRLRTLKERSGKERVRLNPRSAGLLLIVTRMGRDYRPGSRQRTEQVARRAAPLAGQLEQDTASRYQQREIRFRPEATSGRRWSGLEGRFWIFGRMAALAIRGLVWINAETGRAGRAATSTRCSH